ncbi:MAG: hypothetical protein ACLFVR_02655 [Thiohalospira sp.]
MVKERKIKWLIIILAVFQAFNGFSGLLGGFMLIKDPSGISLSMEQSWLNATPFANFLIPGIVLFIINGLGNIAGLWATIRKKTKSAEIGVVFGLIMMVWIIAQVLWIGYKDFLQPFYFSTGLFQMIFGIMLYKVKRK